MPTTRATAATTATSKPCCPSERSLTAVGLVVVLFAAAGYTQTFGQAGAAGDDVVKVIVQFESPPSGRDIHRLAAQMDSERSRLLQDLPRLRSKTLPFRFAYRRVFNGVAASLSRDEIESARKLPYVKTVFDDTPVQLVLSDSVPLIGADQVWSQSGFTGGGIRVAIIDSGVDYEHPDLGSCFGVGCKVIGGFDFFNMDADPRDDFGHGTHVAGIVAANGAVKGVAPDAQILAYKVAGTTGFAASSAIIAALDVAVDPDGDPATDDGAHVANLSLSAPGDPDDPLSQAVDGATDAGMVVAVAAGNNGPSQGSVGSPGTARKAITVGATNKFDLIAEFSSRGPVIWPGGAIIKPDIVAPGVGVCAPRWDDAWAGLECIDQSHVSLSGTSMATPHVAGAAALLRQAHPDWTPAEIKMALRNTALDLGYDPNTQGYGRLQVLPAVELPHAPPIASIATSGALASVVDVLGMATSEMFESYSLYIGEGASPTSWSLLAQSATPVSDGILFAGLEPFDLADGLLTLRLDVTDSDGHVSQDRTLVSVDNLLIFTPRNADIFRRGDSIEIRGSILDPTLKPGWPQRVPWDFEPDAFALKTAAKFHSPSPLASRGVSSSSTSLASMSGADQVSAAQAVTYWWGGFLAPAVGDLDGDGRQEIVVYRSGKPPQVRVYRDNGVLSWSASLGTGQDSDAPGHIPLLTDIDGDDVDEVVVYRPYYGRSFGELYAFGSGGSVLEGWPVSLPNAENRTLLAADLDRDGRMEIVLKGGGDPRTMIIVGSGGEILAQWSLPPKFWFSDEDSSPAVGNLDDESHLEIVVADPSELGGIDPMTGEWNNTGVIHVFKMDGSELPGWPRYTDGVAFGSPAVGDLDGDGKNEIVVGLIFSGPTPDYRYGGLYAFDGSGNVLPGWPVEKGWSVWTSPSLGDLNGDGDLEIAASRVGLPTYLFHHDGSVAAGWPRYKGSEDRYSTILADVDGDGVADVLTTAGSVQQGGGVYAWKYDGSPIGGFPKRTEVDAEASVTVADIDADGQVELIASSDWDRDSETGANKEPRQYLCMGLAGFLCPAEHAVAAFPSR